MDTSQQLKQLNTARTRLITDLTILLTDPLVRSADVSALQGQLSEVEAEIGRIRGSGIIVTDHAVIRYLERVMDLDIHQLRHDILPAHTLKLAMQLGNGQYPIGNGARAVVRDNTVVSIVKKPDKSKKRSRPISR